MPSKQLAPLLAALTLFAVSCGDDDDTAADTAADTDNAAATTVVTDTTEPAGTASATDAPDESAAEPVTGPASITATDQSGDGTSVTVASVSLPTDGFVVVHADGGGSPGPILGWSGLLPAGESTDVLVEFGEPLVESATVYPMAHVDANGNGEYEFMPPDVTIDVPATTGDGAVAVLPIAYEVDGAAEGAADEDAAGADPGLELSTTDLGEIIVDDSGFTVYLFTPDYQSDSICYDECEAMWPFVAEVTSIGDGLDEALLGTTTRTNGDVQATYNGWPLYSFAGDAEPGDVNGQSLNGVWWVVDATGDAVGS